MKKFDSINVIPFIDIMLVLLAIVLATASFISQGKIEVQVPQSSSTATVEAQDLKHLITISKSGDYFYQDAEISLQNLGSALKELAQESKITIKIDAESHFQDFVNVADILSTYNLKKVTVVTEKKTNSL